MRTHKIFVAAAMAVMTVFAAVAENWDQIRNSGQYYYGEGHGTTEAEADAAALAELTGQIATHVSMDFTMIDDITVANGKHNEVNRVLNCVKTYSQSTLTNTEKWVEGKAPDFVVKRYMKKSELARIFDNRISKAKNMVRIADECLERNKIDMALQYYYWAYSLLRSVQFPSEVKDEKGKILVDWIPVRINDILSDISVVCSGRDGDYIDLMFTYADRPVTSLEFTYSDGRTDCIGNAKNGKGMMEMIPGYETDTYHVNVEYQFRNQARGDVEMESVLAVITPKVFPKAAHRISGGAKQKAGNGDAPGTLIEHVTYAGRESGAVEDEAKTVTPEGKMEREAIVRAVTEAIASKNYSSAAQYFTIDGLEMFNRLVSYGRARILDDSNLKLYQGLNGRNILRGLEMSFSFDGKQKKTFVEDVNFTFDEENRIEGVAFGMGKVVEESIFGNSAALWSPEVRETIVSFMENYKTAYSLERLDYIRDIFADDAVIISGTVLKKRPGNNPERFDGKMISLGGQELIRYNRFTKTEYLDHLERVFNNNEFINLKFTDHEVQWLEKFDKETLFAINIRQQYASSTYSDEGYLFLLVDMTNPEEPVIKVRTWQPNEVAIDKLYNAGDFFDD